MKYMKLALKEAYKAYEKREVPVGAIIVLDGKVIARGHNCREGKQLVTGHAEIEAITKAQNKLGTWRLENCVLYVTLEPCPMCSGAIIQSRIKKVVYGCKDYKAGACGSVLNLFEHKFNHSVEICGGVMEKETSELISKFFKEIRKQVK